MVVNVDPGDRLLQRVGTTISSTKIRSGGGLLHEEGQDLEGGEQFVVVFVVVVVVGDDVAVAEVDLGARRADVAGEAADVRRLQPRWAGQVDAPNS